MDQATQTTIIILSVTGIMALLLSIIGFFIKHLFNKSQYSQDRIIADMAMNKEAISEHKSETKDDFHQMRLNNDKLQNKILLDISKKHESFSSRFEKVEHRVLNIEDKLVYFSDEIRKKSK